MTWSIYYDDSTIVRGSTEADWQSAPSMGVQVIVEHRKPGIDERPWIGVLDRICWTGEDVYDPFGWGPKYGTLMERSLYDAIWKKAING